MYKWSSTCIACSEPKRYHDKKWRCRYEQPGWNNALFHKPPENQPILARRGQEVFVAVWHHNSEGESEWYIPRFLNGEKTLCLIIGVDAWRQLRREEPVVPDFS